MDYGLKQALKVLIALACGVSVTAASISVLFWFGAEDGRRTGIHGWDDCLC